MISSLSLSLSLSLARSLARLYYCLQLCLCVCFWEDPGARLRVESSDNSYLVVGVCAGYGRYRPGNRDSVQEMG